MLPTWPASRGSSREHTESDLRCYLSWCAERGLDPLAAQRPHLELYIRSMQEIRRFKPSTVSRRFSVVAGFYRTCVLDGLIEHSPAEHVRRPAVPAESPTLGFTHLQFEALLTAARESPNPSDFALVAMLGLLGLRIFEATGADIADIGEEHGHRVLRVCGKGTKVVQVPLPPAVGRAIDRAVGRRDRGPTLLNRRGVRMDRHAATRRLRRLAQATGQRTNIHPHMLRHTFVTTISMPAWTSGTCRSQRATPIRAPRCAMTGPAPTWTATRTTSWPPTCPQQPDQPASPRLRPGETLCIAEMSISSVSISIHDVEYSHALSSGGRSPRNLFRIFCRESDRVMHGSSSSRISSVSEHISRCSGCWPNFRDMEVAAMRSLHPELLGAGRVDPTQALRGASKGTWFGNILNERVRQRVQTAITETLSRHS